MTSAFVMTVWAAAAVSFAGSGRTPEVVPADATAVLAAVKAPGARAVLVNVWATWCEPCREEMPDILRFYRDHRAKGLRLVLVSADDEEQRAEVGRVLGALGFDERAYLKTGKDAAFIDALEPKWSGALPATILFDGQGTRRHFWSSTVDYGALETRVAPLLPQPNTKPKPKGATGRQP